MSSITREYLSGSTSGLPIQITTSTTTGTTSGQTIHTSTATGKDEVWLWASNHSTVTTTLKLVLQLGTVSGGRETPQNITGGGSGLTLVLPGLSFGGGAVVKAHAASGVSLALQGYINRMVT